MFLGLKLKEKDKEKEVLDRALSEMQFLREEIISIKSQLERLRTAKGDILGEDSALVELAAGVSGEGVYWHSKDTAEGGGEQEEKSWQISEGCLVVCQDHKDEVEQIADIAGTNIEMVLLPSHSETIVHEADINKNVINDIIAVQAVGENVEEFTEKAPANIDTIDDKKDDKIDEHSNSEGQMAAIDNSMTSLSEDILEDAARGDWSVVKAPGRKAAWWKFWQREYMPNRSV